MAMERENRAPRGNGRKRRKVCQFCVDKCELLAVGITVIALRRGHDLDYIVHYRSRSFAAFASRTESRSCRACQ